MTAWLRTKGEAVNHKRVARLMRQIGIEAIYSYLENRGIRISQDGKRRAFDNIFIERLWRRVKYEEVYLKDYSTVAVAIKALGNYFESYNHQRLHQALGYQVPAAVHFSR
jgi:putative transposase